MIWLKVGIAGQSKPLDFLLDSGAGQSDINLGTAQRIGAQLGARKTVLGMQGRCAAYRVNSLTATLASVPVPRELLALDLSSVSAGCGARIDGLLGADFFRGRIVQIDFASQTLRLLQRNEVNEAGCEILPLTTRNDAYCVWVSVDGNSPEWLRLDTGCNTALEWVVTGERAKKLGITTIGLNSGSVRAFHADVQFGSKCVSAVKTGIHTEQMFAGEAGLIGNGLLSRFTVTIDPAKRRCLLASN